MALVIPEIIGWPGAVSGPVTDNAPPGTDMYDHLVRTLNLAYIRPCIIRGRAGSEVWTSELATELYMEFLTKGAGITGRDIFPKNPNGITVAFQHMSPISESYSNEFSQNSILANIGGGKENLQDIGMLLGPDGTFDTLKEKAQGTGYDRAFDLLDKSQAGLENLARKIGGDAGKAFTKDIIDTLKKFDHKIDFPMMWRGSSFSTSYSLMIRLFNPVATNDDWYERLIVAPLMALLAFVCPRSTDGKTWTYPFVMKFDIPGRASLQSAYCSNISVVKGGDVNDVAYNSRPNMVDINMTINPVHSVKLLSTEPMTSDAPSLETEVSHALNTTIKKPKMGVEIGTPSVQEKPGTINRGTSVPTNSKPPASYEQQAAAAALSHT